MPEKDRVTIFDTTLRDGEQSPGCSMTVDGKVRMARQLERLGVDVIEAGFPVSSEGDFQSVRTVAREIRRPVIVALARCSHGDIQQSHRTVFNAGSTATSSRVLGMREHENDQQEDYLWGV